MRRASIRTAGVGVSAGVLLACAGSALGQNALGDGRLLDANLHATQGRYNVQGRGIEDQIRFNNSVIAGTAPGGMSFRGITGYRATDQFGAALGSNTLYNFQRDSFSSAVVGSGVRGSDALRYQFALTTGQYVPSFMAAAPIAVPRSGTVANSADITALRSTADFVSGQSVRPVLLGSHLDETGAQYVAKASPLLGVTWVKTAESPQAKPLPPATAAVPTTNVPPTVSPDGAPVTPPAPPPLGTVVPPAYAQPGETPAPGGTPPPGTTPPPPPGERPLQPGITGLESTSRGMPNLLNREDTGVETKADESAARPDTAIHTQIITRFREGFQEAPQVAPGAGQARGAPELMTYEEQMERLRRIMRGEPEPKSADGKPAPTAAPIRAPDGTIIPPTRSPKPGTGDNAQPAPGAGANTPPPTFSEKIAAALKKEGEIKVDHFVEAPKPGDAYSNPEAYRAMMSQGEDLVGQGRFFDAEERFTRALASLPGDPMARAGRVHAEIGAGLYLSAAANLRSLFADHPEMIGTRYADRLLPGAERSTVIVDQLREQEKKAESALGRESALLLAYMGYQRGEPKLIAEGLGDLADRAIPGEGGDPDRSLVQVLRAAWTAK